MSERPAPTTTLEGRCLCGSVHYEIVDVPESPTVVRCHCTVCQRQGGAPFSLNLIVPEASLRVSGDTLGEIVTVGEETHAEVLRRFCTACGSPIVSILGARPGVVAVKAGTLDDPSRFRPTAEIWTRSKQPWVEADATLRVLPTGFPVG